MVRIVKAPEERREDILAVTADLFMRNGYEATSVDQIVRAAAIAKGTFYYYFSSKKAVLEAIARQVVQRIVQVSQSVGQQQPGLGAIGKICAIFVAQRGVEQQERALVDDLHRPENRALHDQINIETIKAIAPIWANVVEQGCDEGVFDVPDPLSTMQFILAGSQMIFGQDAFDWTPEELRARHEAMIVLIERALGAAPGSISLAIQQALLHEAQGVKS
jgi:AcrR family transcriptional regulator